jgi:hypothetical protein
MLPHLTGHLIARAELAPHDIAQLYSLFTEHFAGANEQTFLADLANKNWVIVLREGHDGCIQGFSTLALYVTLVAGQPISVVCSGDTLIRPAFWGTPALPRTWIKNVLALAAEMPQPLYWLLISSGYKTYRFLSVFYRQFYPHYDEPTPQPMQQLMDQLAQERFGEEYHPTLGIVRFRQGATPLRPGVADLPAERLQDSHIAFFVACNPRYWAGDELVCLTRVQLDNLTPAGQRMVR